MLSPPSYSPAKRAGSTPTPAHGSCSASPSKLTRSPLWLRSPPGRAPPTHIATASPAARRGLFSSGDDGDEAGSRPGPAPTPIERSCSPQDEGLARQARPARAVRTHRSSSSDAATAPEDSPTAAAALRWHGSGASRVAAGASAQRWDTVEQQRQREGGNGGRPGYPALNLSSVAASAQQVAAAVLRVGVDALTGPGAAADLEARTEGALSSSELLRRTARSLSPHPETYLSHGGSSSGRSSCSGGEVPQEEQAAVLAARPLETQQGTGLGQQYAGGALQAGGAPPAGVPKASPALRAKLLLGYLQGDDHAKLQGALSLLLDHLKTGKLSATDMMGAGAVPLLAGLIARHCTGCTAADVAAVPEGDPDHPVERGATALSALEVANALVVALPPRDEPDHAGALLLPLVAPVLDILQLSAARLRAHGEDAVGDAPPDGAPQWPRLPIMFYAGSVVVRLSVFAEPAAALVRGGAIATLAGNLAAHPTVLPQVCVFALYKLLDVGSHADNLLELMLNEGAHGLVAFMANSGSKKGDTAACELVATMLLGLALLPEAPQAAADADLVAPLVKLLGPAAPNAAVRMYALLVLGRLGSRSSAVQMDLAREGAVPYLVALMGPEAQEAEQLHAARLTAILAQAVPTHQVLQSNDVMEALLRLLQSDRPAVVEHAASVFSVLANNPSTHFQVVGWGAVPVLVRLLQPASSPQAHYEFQDGQLDVGAANSHPHVCSPKTQTYVLATLLLLAMHEPRHADVICRSGAIPSLVRLCSKGGSPSVREYAAAVLACMAHTVDVQVDIIGSGGIPALVSLLDEGVPEAQAHAAEVLVTLSAVDDHRKRLITRASEILTSLLKLIQSDASSSRYWGATLLHMLCRDDGVLLEVLEMKAVVPALANILSNTSMDQEAEARLAQVQAAWLVARLCESADASAALAGLHVAPSLVSLVAAGMLSLSQGLGGGVHYGSLSFAPPRDSFPDAYSDLPGVVRAPSSSGRGGDGGPLVLQGQDTAGTGAGTAGTAEGGSRIAEPHMFRAGAAFGVTSSSSVPPAASDRVSMGAQEGRVEVRYTNGQVHGASSNTAGSSSENGGSSGVGEQGGGSTQGAGGRPAKTGASSSHSTNKGKGGSRVRKPQLRIEPLESNAHAAGVAALLALARSSSAGRESVETALAFQEAWAGGSAPRVVLAALAAPAIS